MSAASSLSSSLVGMIDMTVVVVVVVVIEGVVSDEMLVCAWSCARGAAGFAAEPTSYVAAAGPCAARWAAGVVVEGGGHAAPLRTGRGGWCI